MMVGGTRKPMDIRTRHDAGHTVLEVVGELDMFTAPRLRDQLVTLAADGRNHLVVDLAELAFMDSSGLGVLVGGLKRARAAGGGVSIAGASERILSVLRITGLVRVFPVYATTAEALSAVDR